jgi:hypothetical protein
MHKYRHKKIKKTAQTPESSGNALKIVEFVNKRHTIGSCRSFMILNIEIPVR